MQKLLCGISLAIALSMVSFVEAAGLTCGACDLKPPTHVVTSAPCYVCHTPPPPVQNPAPRATLQNSGSLRCFMLHYRGLPC